MPTGNVTKTFTATTQGLVNPDIVTFFLTFNLTICGNVLGILGILGNVVSLANFLKDGVQDSVSITLSALVFSDIGALFTQMFINVLISPFWNNIDHPFYTFSIVSALLVYPREYFIRVSGIITVFATFERCLCVIIPFRVKRIITRDVAIIVNMCIFLVTFLYLFPPYFVTYLDWREDERKNKSLIVIVYRDNAESVLKVSYMVTDLFLPYCTFFVLIVCNTVIVVTLKSKSKWRQSVTKSSEKQDISTKEKKLVLMLVTVSTIFIGCLFPQSAMLTAVGVVRELKLNGLYFDVSLLVYSFTFLLETINCSVNIIVYYNMSSKFRDRLQEWFPCLNPKS
ncbi:FMRFamide receptor-like [Biomphalaria glabrata]|uniref:FMRFamide receptor-like n=1 Tax=Biomphalaria glabrata TaxID=6526 RepID=A0A9W2ZF32_BIOGL|nr:FMRFamide receptor-like [Biomphalaria glabrata]